MSKKEQAFDILTNGELKISTVDINGSYFVHYENKVYNWYEKIDKAKYEILKEILK